MLKRHLDTELGFDLDNAMTGTKIPDNVKQLKRLIKIGNKVTSTTIRASEEPDIQPDEKVLFNNVNANYLADTGANALDKLREQLIKDPASAYEIDVLRHPGAFGDLTGDSLHRLAGTTNAYDASEIELDVPLTTERIEVFLNDIGIDMNPIGQRATSDPLPAPELQLFKLWRVAKEAGPNEVLLHAVILLSVDRRVNQPMNYIDTAFGQRSTTQLINEMVGMAEGRLIEEQVLDRWPLLWYRFIDNLEPRHGKRAQLLAFLGATQFNDTTIGGTELYSGMSSRSQLNFEQLKESRYSDGIKVELNGYGSELRRCYELAELRMITVADLAFLDMEDMGEPDSDDPNTTIDSGVEQLSELRSYIVQVKDRYLAKYPTDTIPELTAGKGSLVYACSRIDVKIESLVYEGGII